MKFATIYLLLSLTVIEDIEVHLIDIITAFLNRLLPRAEVVYMKATEGSRLLPRMIVRLL